jgi:membrane associated rhomboid family serine protease
VFPLKDNVPSRSFPVMTVGLIVVNCLIFFAEVAMGSRALEGFVTRNGLVPQVVTGYFSGEGLPVWRVFLPFFTSIFLHGGWIHLLGNMWYLWIFGDNVEDRLGRVRFLGFYVLCGLVGNLAHYLANSGSAMPAIGASGAIAGVLGAYAVSYPRARVTVLIPLFIVMEFIELPAMLVLGFWFVLQFLNGAASFVVSSETGGVAWWAHIGGFVGGIGLLFLFRPRPRTWRRVSEDAGTQH